MIETSDVLRKQIENHGEQTYPNECCGILLGKVEADGRKVLVKLSAAGNTREAAEQYHRFEISADELLGAERQAMKKGLDVLGFYHSHPDHLARPSEYDRQHAFPFYSYIIVSVAKGKAEDFTCWELDDRTLQFNEEEIAFV